jgi:hypothetical protein
MHFSTKNYLKNNSYHTIKPLPPMTSISRPLFLPWSNVNTIIACVVDLERHCKRKDTMVLPRSERWSNHLTLTRQT